MKYKVVSDDIIYILCLILYFSLYSTQWGCLTWKFTNTSSTGTQNI